MKSLDEVKNELATKAATCKDTTISGYRTNKDTIFNIKYGFDAAIEHLSKDVEGTQYWIYHNKDGTSDVYDSPLFLQSDEAGRIPVHVITYSTYLSLKATNLELQRKNEMYLDELSKQREAAKIEWMKLERKLAKCKEQRDFHINFYDESDGSVASDLIETDNKELEAIK